MTVIIRPDGEQSKSMQELFADVSDVLGEPVKFGFGGVVLTDDQARAYFTRQANTPAADEAPARKTPAKKSTPAKTAARGRSARGTGE